MARKPPKGKSLAEVNPELAKQWHLTKNGDLTPNDVFAVSGKKVWWKCPKGDDHEWEASLAHRTRSKSGCSVCGGRIVVRSNSLKTCYPLVAKMWHPTKNNNLTPNDVTFSSNKKVWWKCPKGDDHVWITSVGHRTKNNSGCPICSGHKVALSTSIYSNYPKLVKEWHPTLNKNKRPKDYSKGSNVQIWWMCSSDNKHIFKASIGNRVNSDSCPYCSNRLINNKNSLKGTNPEVARYWHPTKNGSLTPNDVVAGSGKKVWWKCPEGDDHEFKKTINSKVKNNNCFICTNERVVRSNCLATVNPEIAKQWHSTKNGSLTPNDVTAGSSKKVWWKCDKGDDHEWSTSISHRSNGRGCPYCSGSKADSKSNLGIQNKELTKQWHPTKNSNLNANDFLPNSSKVVWWKCPVADDHEFKSSIRSRNSSDGINSYACPMCSGKKLVDSNSIGVLYPNLINQWHPTKNKLLTPFDFTKRSSKKVWWKCPEGDDHEWELGIRYSLRRKICPFCSGDRVSKTNSLNSLYPEIAKQWHPTKNGSLTPNDVTAGSSKKVWWKCPEGDDHEWTRSITGRKNAGCPVCSGHKITLSNCLATKRPKIAEEWHPKRNGSLTPFQVTEFNHTKVWFQCTIDKEHEWKTSIATRTRKKGCPYCSLTPQSRQELTITFELIQFFKEINPKGFKTRVDGKLWSIDIYIPELNLGIEFDGSYWHKDKRALDKLKTKQLKKEGFEIIRVRQSPLKKIFRTDVLSKKIFNGKEVANKVLKQIMKMYDLDGRKVRKIENYLDKKELQNEKGLDKYIDMIFTEKAEKNN